MTDTIGDILGKRKPAEPVEFSVIRSFVKEKFNADCTLQLQNSTVIICVDNSALAGSLQFELHNLEEKTGKKLRIRIS